MDAENRGWSRDYQQAGGGFELVFSGVLFSLAGVWLDRRLSTTPLFIVLLTVIGVTGAVLNLYYRYKRDMARLEADAEARGDR